VIQSMSDETAIHVGAGQFEVSFDTLEERVEVLLNGSILAAQGTCRVLVDDCQQAIHLGSQIMAAGQVFAAHKHAMRSEDSRAGGSEPGVASG
jgi:hypothetical protein